MPLWVDTPIEKTILSRPLLPVIMNKTIGLDIVIRGILDADLIIINWKLACCLECTRCGLQEVINCLVFLPSRGEEHIPLDGNLLNIDKINLEYRHTFLYHLIDLILLGFLLKYISVFQIVTLFCLKAYKCRYYHDFCDLSDL